MKTYWKFAALVAVVVGALVWLAVGGISEDKTMRFETMTPPKGR